MRERNEQRDRADRTEVALTRTEEDIYAQQISRANDAYQSGLLNQMHLLLAGTSEGLRGWEYGYLAAAAPRVQQEFACGQSSLLDLVWSQDGRVAAIDRDGQAVVQHIATGEARFRARVANERITAAAWHPALDRGLLGRYVVQRPRIAG